VLRASLPGILESQTPGPAHLGVKVLLGTQLVHVAEEIRVWEAAVLVLWQLISILSTFHI